MYSASEYAQICSLVMQKNGLELLKESLKTIFPVDGIRIFEDQDCPANKFVRDYTYSIYVLLPGCQYLDYGLWRKEELGVIKVIFSYDREECSVLRFIVPVDLDGEGGAIFEETKSPEKAYWLAYQAMQKAQEGA